MDGVGDVLRPGFEATSTLLPGYRHILKVIKSVTMLCSSLFLYEHVAVFWVRDEPWLRDHTLDPTNEGSFKDLSSQQLSVLSQHAY